MSFIDETSATLEPRDIWVVAEVGTDNKPTPLTLQVVGGARMMADGLGCYVHAVVMGSGLESVPARLVAAVADRVHVADDPSLGNAEACLKVLGDLLAAQPPEILLFGATPLADELAPRLAERLAHGK